MITSIRLKNFKNFVDETLRVGPFTILVGANASGKSNIRDAFRFLSGIGRGYTLAEIMGGKYGVGGQLEWEPLRGAVNEIVRFGQSAFSLEVGIKSANEIEPATVKNINYSLQIQRDDTNGIRFRVTAESLTVDSEVLYTSQPSDNAMSTQEKDSKLALCLNTSAGQVERDDIIVVASDRPGLRQPDFLETLLGNEYVLLKHLGKNTLEWVSVVIGELERIRLLELSPERMREPAFPGATVLGDSGENLPMVLQEICADSKRKEVLISWIAELTPMDVTGFEFPIDPSGRVHLMLCEANGRKVSAYSASDGTLRFLAMLAALLSENSKDLYFFEEIDTGIHPARQWLLLELIEKQAAKRGIQVVTTTHSPDLLTFANDSTFEHLSVVCRLEDSQDAIIRPVAELPNAKKLRTSQGGLGRLLTSRWMETALAFTEDYDEAEDDS